MSDIKAWHDEIEKRKDIADRIKRELELELSIKAKEKEDLERVLEIKRIKLAIENTYDEIINIYKEFDIEALAKPNNITALNRSYGTRAGAVVTKRGKLRKKLKELDV